MGPKYNGHFRVIVWVGRVAYSLGLPDELNQIHSTFHVSQLWKWLVDDFLVVPYEDIQVDERLDYIQIPIAILDKKTKTMWNKDVGLVKVKWKHRKGLEWTWEPKEEIREHYPDLFASTDFKDEVGFNWERIVTSGSQVNSSSF